MNAASNPPGWGGGWERLVELQDTSDGHKAVNRTLRGKERLRLWKKYCWKYCRQQYGGAAQNSLQNSKGEYNEDVRPVSAAPLPTWASVFGIPFLPPVKAIPEN